MAQTQQQYISQDDLCEFLITKLRNFKNVSVQTRKIENTHGIYYGIDVKNYTLGKLGNGVFHSLSLRTVSHTSRIINIKLVFNDNEQRNADMKLNADAIIQIYREIANRTKDNGEPNNILENIRMDEFEDERQFKHLAIIAESTKGASLIYTYLRTIEFVRIINEKYGTSEIDDDEDIEISEELTTDEIDNKLLILEKKIKALHELRAAKSSATLIQQPTILIHQQPIKHRPKQVIINIGNKTIKTIKPKQ